jgi:hypothetical protein
VFKDRSDFDAKMRQALSGAAAQEVASWEARTPAKLTFLGGSLDDPQLKLNQSYARLRMLLTENHGDYGRVSAIVGPHAAQALRRLEDARRVLATNLPNRAFILRVRNRSPEDAENFTVELKVGGYVYDVTVNEEGEKAHSLQWSPDRINIDVPRLRPGYTNDVQVWYLYLPLSQRVFPDRADVEWEKTQGVVVDNLGISNGQIRRSSGLLTDLHPYHRYALDPVRGSPTFGPLPEPPAEATRPARQPQAQRAPSSVGRNESATETHEPAAPALPPQGGQASSRKASPQSAGAVAVLVQVKAVKHYEQQNEAREAQIRVTKALDDFTGALGNAARAANGYWVYQRVMPTKAEYNNFAGSYDVTGDMLGILRADHPIQGDSLPGWAELQRAGSASVQPIPWDKARYKVVLQFFSDSRDSKKDSKRVLTQERALDQIFDLQQAQAGHANEMAPGFADLLRFTRERLVARYHAPFTLNDVTEAVKPFYLVVAEDIVNENFYLPDSWMAVAEKPGKRRLPDATLSSELWALFDYAESSRQLTPQEFASIFGAK